MSGRGDYRRRDRSQERGDRSRGNDGYARGGRRPSRSRSRSRSRSPPPRRDARDRRDDERRRDSRGDYDRRDRDRDRRDDRRDKQPLRDDSRREQSRRAASPPPSRKSGSDNQHEPRSRAPDATQSQPRNPPTNTSNPAARPKAMDFDDDAEPSPAPEDAMNGVEDDEDAIAAMMGFGSFGSTKGLGVEGNQEGAVNIKKQRTWRQYMNRRGGFNRPLDKIK